MSIVVLFYVFFFQAEDGIRDTSVTGVQTCALPICTFWPAIERYDDPRSLRLIRSVMAGESPSLLELDDRRSEERRVGKGCRARGGACSVREDTHRAGPHDQFRE